MESRRFPLHTDPLSRVQEQGTSCPRNAAAEKGPEGWRPAISARRPALLTPWKQAPWETLVVGQSRGSTKGLRPPGCWHRPCRCTRDTAEVAEVLCVQTLASRGTATGPDSPQWLTTLHGHLRTLPLRAQTGSQPLEGQLTAVPGPGGCRAGAKGDLTQPPAQSSRCLRVGPTPKPGL